ncbi:MAG: hypothetical protein KKH75_06240 [Actinobacteria bacterium]|nr:hypothetical protein [Actinomycetota bacterium]
MTTPAPPVTLISPRRRLIVLAVICGVFAVMGVVTVALSPETTLNLIVGVGAFGFFGVGGGIAFVSQWRRSTILRADDDGIRVTGIGWAPWDDIDRIGSTSSMLGIRLRRYDTLLKGAPGVHTPTTLRATRAASGGWDLTWTSDLLDRTPQQAASDLLARRP